MQDGLNLKDVVLLGRTWDEYAAYFCLTAESLRGKRVLDCASGVSSFGAEARERGLLVTGADPIYGTPAEKLEAKCRADLEEVGRQLPNILHKYRWDFYKNPETLYAFRESAYKRFLPDFAAHPRHYVRAALPELPFEDASYDLVLVSFFLYMYADRFDAEFHSKSLAELMRVAKEEIRIYPLVDLKGQRPAHLDALKSDPKFQDWIVEECPAGMEFQLNATHYLSLRKR
jgi:SAM-dependent methyltransferase